MAVIFPPSFEPKLRFENKNSECDKFDWRYFLKIFRRSWLGKIIIFLVFPLIVLNFWLFRYDDFGNSCHIKIAPSITEMNNLQIKKGIRMLKEKSPQDYREFCASVKSISPELACGGGGGGCYVPSRPNEIVVSTIFRRKESHTEMTAAIIAHEVCHLHQGKEKRPFDETECYNDYCRVLKIMGARDDYDNRCNDGRFLNN